MQMVDSSVANHQWLAVAADALSTTNEAPTFASFVNVRYSLYEIVNGNCGFIRDARDPVIGTGEVMARY